jgi:hypothetical protein
MKNNKVKFVERTQLVLWALILVFSYLAYKWAGLFWTSIVILLITAVNYPKDKEKK